MLGKVKTSFNHCKRPVKIVQASLSIRKLRYSRLNHRGGPAKTVKNCLNLKDRESRFHTCGCPVKLMKAYLSAGKLCYSRFNHRGCPVNTVKGGFNLRKVGENSFYTCGSQVKLVQVC